MTTLNDIINRLPRVLGRRYAEPFWVNAANKVLMDIEQKMELPRIKEEFGLILKERVTNYKIPSYVKKILGVYRVGNPNTNYKLDEVGFTIRGQMIEIPSGFNVLDESLVDNAVIKAGSDQLTILSDDFIDGIEHRLLYYKDGENAGFTSMIQRYDHQVGVTPENIAYLKRPLPFDVLAAENVSIHSNFLIVEYVTGFGKIADLVCDIVPDEDVQRVLEEGLRYYGETQTDEESEFAMRWERQYDKAMRQYMNRRSRGIFKQKPKFAVSLNTIRSEPGRLYGNNSGVYGDPEQQGP